MNAEINALEAQEAAEKMKLSYWEEKRYSE
jgi:hypothetical protein